VPDDSTAGKSNEIFDLVYSKFGQTRFTQDSPILLSVFEAFYQGADQVDVLITPDWSIPSAQLSSYLTIALDLETTPVAARATDETQLPPEVAYNKSVVAARLTFDQLIFDVLPLSGWWLDFIVRLQGVPIWTLLENPGINELIRAQLVEGFKAIGALENTNGPAPIIPPSEQSWLLHRDFVWAAHLFVLIKGGPNPATKPHDASEFAMQFLDGAMRHRNATKAALQTSKAQVPDSAWVFSVQLNRTVVRSIHRSVRTTKGDAAVRAFDIDGGGIVWAIVDTGIDATHEAFRRDLELDPFVGHNTRIRATYNFANIRSELSASQRRSVYHSTSSL